MVRKIYKGGDYSEVHFLFLKSKFRLAELEDAAWLDIGIRITVKSC